MLEIITGENIEKLEGLAHKDSVNECVEWLIAHYQMVCGDVVKLRDENIKLEGEPSLKTAALDVATAGDEELKAKIETLEKENNFLTKPVDQMREIIYTKTREITELKRETGELKETELNFRKMCESLEKENEELKDALNKHYSTLSELDEKADRAVINVDRIKKENEELKERIAELEESEKQSIETMKIMGINCIGDLVKQNEDLKEQLRSITAMDKEEPYERIESLIEDIRRLTAENEILKSDNENLNRDIKEQESNSMYIEGKVDAYEYVIDALKKD